VRGHGRQAAPPIGLYVRTARLPRVNVFGIILPVLPRDHLRHNSPGERKRESIPPERQMVSRQTWRDLRTRGVSSSFADLGLGWHHGAALAERTPAHNISARKTRHIDPLPLISRCWTRCERAGGEYQSNTDVNGIPTPWHTLNQCIQTTGLFDRTVLVVAPDDDRAADYSLM